MLKAALQWSVYPQRTGRMYRHLGQQLQSGPCMLALILPTPEGSKIEWTLAGKVTQIFNPRPGRGGPKDWKADILLLRQHLRNYKRLLALETQTSMLGKRNASVNGSNAGTYARKPRTFPFTCLRLALAFAFGSRIFKCKLRWRKRMRRRKPKREIITHAQPFC